MKQIFHRVISLLLVGAILCCLAPLVMYVQAEETNQDGLTVLLTTDQDSYKKDDPIIAVLSVKNEGKQAVTNVSMKVVGPQNYTLETGKIETHQIEKMNPAEETAIRVTYLPQEMDGGQEPVEAPVSAKRGNMWFLFAGVLIIILAIAIIVLVVKSALAKKILCLVLVLSLMMPVFSARVNAVEADIKVIEITELVKVEDEDVQINATVSYQMAEVSAETEATSKPTVPEKTTAPTAQEETTAPTIPEETTAPTVPEETTKPTEPDATTPTKPEDPTPNEEYYWDNSTVIDVIDAEDSDDIPTAKSVEELLAERGFVDFPVTYEYTMSGEYVGDTEITDETEGKYPMYSTYYISANNELWTIFVINGVFMANPASFNLESGLGVQLLISETQTLTSYDSESNQYYVTIPYDTAVILKTIDRIDANTLDSLTIEEVGKL